MIYDILITEKTIVPKDEKLCCEGATRILIEDESGGEFVVVRQSQGEMRIDPDEWNAVRSTIDEMINRCRP